MIAGLFWMIAANAAVLLGAHAILRRLRSGQADLDLLLFLLLRQLLITATVLGTALAGALRGPLLGGLGLAALALLLAAGEHRRLPRFRRPELPRLAWVLAGVVVLRLLFQIWFLAPAGIDTLSYHLPKVAAWIREGALAAGPGVDCREYLPAGFELLEAWWVVFLGHDVVIEAAGVELLATGFTAVVVLARSMGLTDRTALATGLFYALTPGVYLLSISCANDPAVAFLYLSSAALLVRRAPPLLLCIPLGLGIGIKATLLVAAPGLLLLSVLGRREPRLPAPSGRLLWPTALLALFCGGFWYLRNTFALGGPFHPADTTTLPIQPAPLAAALDWLPARLHLLLLRGVYDDGRLYAALPNHCGWGPLVFCAGIPALAPALRDWPALRRLAAAVGVSFVSLVLFAAPPLHYQRFALFVPVLPLLAIACLASTRPSVRAFLAFPAAALLAITCVPQDLESRDLRELAALPWRERAARLELRSIPPADPVAYAYGINSTAYRAEAPDFRRRIVALRDASTPEDLRDLLRTRGARWLCTTGTAESESLRGLIVRAVRLGYLRQLDNTLFECVAP